MLRKQSRRTTTTMPSTTVITSPNRGQHRQPMTVLAAPGHSHHHKAGDNGTPRCGAILTYGRWRQIHANKSTPDTRCPDRACFGHAA